MTTSKCETRDFLSWLGGLLETAPDVAVEIVVLEEEAEARSSIHVTLRDLPGRLAGFELRPAADARGEPASEAPRP